MPEQTINDHPLKVTTASSEYDGETINDHPMLVTIVGGGGGGGGDSYDFANGLTEADGTVKLGGQITERVDLDIDADADGLYINHAGGSNIGISAGQATLGVTGLNAGYISMYPSMVGIAAESGGGAVQNLILLQPGSLTLTSLPSSRDDSDSTTPANFLYTSTDGVVLSSPLSEISPTEGTERQVVGFDENGKSVAVTLGWAQLSDQPNPPDFPNGVLTMAHNTSTDKDEFGLVQVALDDDFNSIVIEQAIPAYSTGPNGGQLAVADPINLNHATTKQYVDSGLDTKADLVSGRVVESQLPSYVDNVQEVTSLATLPSTGADNVIYVTTDTNKVYRWGGTGYVEVAQTISLGETSATAYRGDRGKAAFEHTSNTSNPHSVTKAQVGLPNVDNTSDSSKPISTATATALATKANTVHTHAISDVTNLQTQLSAKVSLPSVNGSVPVLNQSGAQASLPYSNPIAINSIPVRGTDNNFDVGAPTSGAKVANKTYVDAQGFISRSTVNNIVITEYINRTEYQSLITFNVTVPTGVARYLTVTTNRTLPVGVTFDTSDEYYISPKCSERALLVNAWDNTSRQIVLGFANSWDFAVTSAGSVFIKLVKYKA